ncbi:VOC family protein [Alteromonadaceae bacterium BrNp21-10]|nr:VOC family protein [Alteromonadaceae bacterium BrNp21-10]
MSSIQPFHLAIPVTDLQNTMTFYGELLGCERGRFSNQWVDWNFFGHQLVTHLVEVMPSQPQHNEVDNKSVPVPHFGVVLCWEQWQTLADKLQAARTQFVIEPYVRFAGEVGEQATMFLLDPCGNALEFKAFKDLKQLFAY